MTIPMPKKEYISIQMTPEHRNRYNILTGALLERQQSDRAIWLHAIFCPLTKISSISLNRTCRLMVSTLRPFVCASKSALVLTTNTPPLK